MTKEQLAAANLLVDAKFKSAMNSAKQMGKTVAPFLVLPAIGAIVNYYMGHKQDKQEAKDVDASLQQILNSNPRLSTAQNLTISRFKELSAVAPVVAKNPTMAARFIEPRLKSGMSIDDVHKLVMIQQAGIGKPDAASRSGHVAGFLADRMLMLFGMDAAKSLSNTVSAGRSEQKKYDDGIKNIFSGGSMNKQASQKVSDECLGEMLADRYVMLRESGFAKEAGVADIAKSGLGRFGKGIAFFAPALALAGIAHGVGAMVDAHQKKKLEQTADMHFKRIRDNSDVIQGNPELANDALDAIKTFAPALAAKPAILKTFIEHTVNIGQMAPQTINDLAVTQGNISKSKHPGFTAGFIGAASPVMSASKSLMGKDMKQDLKDIKPGF
jgi:hypothetical protein